MPSSSTDPIRARLLDWAFKPDAGVDQHGQPLAWSLDCRELTLHGPTLGMIAERMWPWVQSYAPTLVAGPSLSGDPIVAAILLYAQTRGMELSGALLRRQPKSYGLRKLLEGPPILSGTRAVVVDDIMNSGTSSNRVVQALRERGAHPVAVLTIVDLGRPRRHAADDIDHRSLFRAAELGLTPAAAPHALDCSWSERGVNSAIPDGRVSAPLFAGRYIVLAGNRRGVLLVDDLGCVTAVAGEPALLAASAGDDLVLAGAASVRCLDAGTLQLRWTRQLRARILCCPGTDCIFVDAEGDGLLVLDSATGATRTCRPALRDLRSLHACAGIPLAITSSALHGLDETLTGRWKWPHRVVSVATVSGDRFVALTSDARLVCVDARDGQVAWARDIGRAPLPRVAAADDGIVCAIGCTAIGFSSAGQVAWIHTAPNRIVAGPVDCGAGLVAIADRRGCIQLLDRRDGACRAAYEGLRQRPLVLAGSRDRLAGIDCDGTSWGMRLV